MVYSANFTYAVERTLGFEGGYVNDEHDHGGPTNFGITALVASKHGIHDVSKITRAQAIQIYHEDYWLECGLDRINSKSLTAELFDTAVNCGVSVAARNLQDAHNVLFCPPERELRVDGVVGDVTIAAVNKQLPRYEQGLWKACNGEQYLHYKAIKRADPIYAERYIKGWTAQRL